VSVSDFTLMINNLPRNMDEKSVTNYFEIIGKKMNLKVKIAKVLLIYNIKQYSKN